MEHRRKLIVLVLLLALARTSLAFADEHPNAPPFLDRNQAFSMIKDNIAPDHPGLFVSDHPIQGGTEIPSWGKTLRVPANFGQAWFFFVDDQPQANWGHDCRYFFVDIQTGRFGVVSALTPPDNWSRMEKFQHPPKNFN
ncbi:MAG: hypothetical protein HUK40_08990 [Desulfobacter sp.]|nr:hypothetical protein [Desulfobacter sp.]WDP84637.1 MAG: hypothetical protein HUN05_05320 [Desulfobacter sp.]